MTGELAPDDTAELKANTRIICARGKTHEDLVNDIMSQMQKNERIISTCLSPFDNAAVMIVLEKR